MMEMISITYLPSNYHSIHYQESIEQECKSMEDRTSSIIHFWKNKRRLRRLSQTFK